MKKRKKRRLKTNIQKSLKARQKREKLLRRKERNNCARFGELQTLQMKKKKTTFNLN